MIIDITGFGYSGSGAFLDLLLEYEEIEFPWSEEFELSILHNVDGIKDLEYKLLYKHCRFFDSDIAIKRFLHLVKDHYNMRGDLRGKAYPICLNYIRELIGIRFDSQSIYDQIYFCNLKTFVIKYYNFFISALFKNKMSKLFFKASTAEKFKMNNFNTKYLSYNPDNFVNSTRKMMGELLSIKRTDIEKILITDHLMPPDDPIPYFTYIDEEIKCIIVRRDPRDTYILAKEKYKRKIPIPVDNVNDFIWFYKYTIEQTKINSSGSVLSINFEDLVYNYNDTIHEIELFCGISKHISPFKYFDPNKSINNTQLYKTYRQYSNDIANIEEQLPDSLFDFSKYESIEHDNRNIF